MASTSASTSFVPDIVEDTAQGAEPHVEPLEVSQDGQYTYLPLTSKYVTSVMNLLHGSFFCHEMMCILTRTKDYAEAREDINEQVVRDCTKDGISFICVKKADSPDMPDYVIGVALNRIEPKEDPFWKTMFYRCNHDCSRSYCKCRFQANRMDKLPNTIENPELGVPGPAVQDLFQLYDTDQAFTTAFLCTHLKFRRIGVAEKLMRYSIRCAQDLRNGINSRYRIYGKYQPMARPGLLKGVFIGDAAKQLAEKLGLTKVDKPEQVLLWHLDWNIVANCSLYYMVLEQVEQEKPMEEDIPMVEVHHSKDSPIEPPPPPVVSPLTPRSSDSK